MIGYALLLMIGLELKMSTTYFMLLGIGACVKCISAGIEMQKKSR